MPVTIEAPDGYGSLALAFGAALDQASRGKGKERHAEDGEPFGRQPICEVARRVGLGYPLGQAVKKVYESRRLPPERARAELLGAMNYLAAAWILLGGAEDVMGPAPEKPVPAPEHPKASGNVCLGFAERAVSLMKECGIARMESQDGSARLSADGTVTGFRFVMEESGSGAPRTTEELLKRIRDCNPAAYAPEDVDAAPRFQKWELVEYRSPDGKWKPACFMHMDGGYAVLVSGGEKFEVPAFDVRPAEKA